MRCIVAVPVAEQSTDILSVLSAAAALSVLVGLHAIMRQVTMYF